MRNQYPVTSNQKKTKLKNRFHLLLENLFSFAFSFFDNLVTGYRFLVTMKEVVFLWNRSI